MFNHNYFSVSDVLNLAQLEETLSIRLALKTNLLFGDVSSAAPLSSIEKSLKRKNEIKELNELSELLKTVKEAKIAAMNFCDSCSAEKQSCVDEIVTKMEERILDARDKESTEEFLKVISYSLIELFQKHYCPPMEEVISRSIKENSKKAKV